jgi:phage-related holin
MNIGTIFKYAAFTTGGVVVCFEPAAFAVWLIACLMAADIFSGITASFREGESLKSSKARWGVVKAVSYIAIVLLVYFVCDRMGVEKSTSLMVIKAVMWYLIYVEGLSISENLLRIEPGNRFFQGIHYFFSFKMLKLIPYLSDFMKEDKDKTKRDDKQDSKVYKE